MCVLDRMALGQEDNKMVLCLSMKQEIIVVSPGHQILWEKVEWGSAVFTGNGEWKMNVSVIIMLQQGIGNWVRMRLRKQDG